MKKIIKIACLSLVCSSAFAFTPLGSVNPNVTQSNISTTICVPNWTSTIRPPVSYTNKLKVKQIKALGYKDTNMSHYEEDHFIALGIGGHPTDPDNLFPQPYAGECGAKAKDKLETKLHDMVCKRQMNLVNAQKEMKTNWVAAYNKYVPTRKNGLTKLTCK